MPAAAVPRGDAAALHAVANDPRVTRWMTARFPYPYTREDAEEWIASVALHEPTRHDQLVYARLASDPVPR